MYYPYIGRFIFDNLAMWVLNVIGINIFAGKQFFFFFFLKGYIFLSHHTLKFYLSFSNLFSFIGIIIDTFGSLKDE